MDRSAPDSVVELIAPLFAAYAPGERPLLVALAERVAAERYRGWASACDDASGRSLLLGCAAREDHIAQLVEALHPDASEVQRRMRDANPELEGLYASLFEKLSLADQYALQAEAERAGATTWRALAASRASAEHAKVYEVCALLEEESAAVLEALVGAPASG